MPWKSSSVAQVVAVDELLVGEHVAVGVQDALRETGRAGRVVELGRVVGGRVHGRGVRGRVGQQPVVEHDHVLDEVAIDPVGVGGVGDEHLRLRVGDAVADALVAVEHRHREQDRAQLPGAEEHGRRLGRRRQQHRDPVAPLDAVVAQHVGELGREVLQLAPADAALVAAPVLPHHRELVARVLVAHVGGDVVARRARPSGGALAARRMSSLAWPWAKRIRRLRLG